MTADTTPQSRGLIAKFLTIVERVGNALPHPATLFLLLAVLVVIISGIAAQMGLEVRHPATDERITPVSLLTVAGLHRIILEMVTNFTGFAPLGTVLVALLGIGVAESSGLIATCMRPQARIARSCGPSTRTPAQVPVVLFRPQAW